MHVIHASIQATTDTGHPKFIMYGLIEYHHGSTTVVPLARCPACKKRFYVKYGICFEFHCYICRQRKSFDLNEFQDFCRSRDYYVPTFARTEHAVQCLRCQMSFPSDDPETFLTHIDSCLR